MADSSNPRPEVDLCACGHTAHWHGHGGAGPCEHDGDCRCPSFRRADLCAFGDEPAPTIEQCPHCDGALVVMYPDARPRRTRHLSPATARALHAALVMYLADAPPVHTRGPMLPGESPGGDTQKMRGGKLRPNHREKRRR